MLLCEMGPTVPTCEHEVALTLMLGFGGRQGLASVHASGRMRTNERENRKFLEVRINTTKVRKVPFLTQVRKEYEWRLCHLF